MGIGWLIGTQASGWTSRGLGVSPFILKPSSPSVGLFLGILLFLVGWTSSLVFLPLSLSRTWVEGQTWNLLARGWFLVPTEGGILFTSRASLFPTKEGVVMISYTILLWMVVSLREIWRLSHKKFKHSSTLGKAWLGEELALIMKAYQHLGIELYYGSLNISC